MMPRTKPKPLIPGATERQVTAQVHDAARLYGITLTRRNVMSAIGASGKMVRCGEKGESDFEFVCPFPFHRGRKVVVELKHSLFDPRKIRGKKREHFDRQLTYMKKVNNEGGIGCWFRSGDDFAAFLKRLQEWPKLYIEFDADGFAYMTDEEPASHV